MKHPNTRLVFNHWVAERRDGEVPERERINPRAFKPAIGNVFILERVDPLHFVFRLAGTTLCHRYGREFRAHNFLSLWQPTDQRALKALIEQALLSGQAGYATYAAETVDRRRTDCELLLLPTRGAGEASADRIVGIMQPIVVTRELDLRRFVNHTVADVLMYNDLGMSFRPTVAHSLLKGTTPPYLRLVTSKSEVA